METLHDRHANQARHQPNPSVAEWRTFNPAGVARGKFLLNYITMYRCYDAVVRTTIDLPADLHELARQLAHQSNRSISEVVTELIRLGLRRAEPAPTSARGLPQVTVGRPITAEDVNSLDDEG